MRAIIAAAVAVMLAGEAGGARAEDSKPLVTCGQDWIRFVKIGDKSGVEIVMRRKDIIRVEWGEFEGVAAGAVVSAQGRDWVVPAMYAALRDCLLAK